MFYAVEDKSNHVDRLIFTPNDPRLEPDFQGKVIGIVNLYVDPDLGDWPDGADRPEICIGVSEDRKSYRIAQNKRELREAGFTPLEKSYSFGFRSWAAYERICVIK